MINTALLHSSRASTRTHSVVRILLVEGLEGLEMVSLALAGPRLEEQANKSFLINSLAPLAVARVVPVGAQRTCGERT